MPETARERVKKAIKHQEPDRVPIDIGGTASSTIAAGPYRQVAELLNIDITPTYMADVMCQTVMMNEEMLTALGSDAKLVYYMPETWQDGRAYDGTPVKIPSLFNPEETPDGARVIRNSQGIPTVKMPRDGFFFDPCHHPLQNIKTVDDIGKTEVLWHTLARPSWLNRSLEQIAEEVKELRANTDRVLIGDFQGQIFQASQLVRGWTEFMMDLVSKPAQAQAIMEATTQALMESFDVYADTLGPHLDIIQMCDDLGMQVAPWMSPDTYRKMVKPYHSRLYGFIKKRCPHAAILLHSDGSIFPLIEDLIDTGIDILNPIQYTCKNMDLAEMKKTFGQDITFWGAGVETQSTLPFGTVQKVVDEVKRNIDLLAPGGGFVFAAVHNVTEGVPPENVITAFETAQEYGKK